jgi:hypothetical protein
VASSSWSSLSWTWSWFITSDAGQGRHNAADLVGAVIVSAVSG